MSSFHCQRQMCLWPFWQFSYHLSVLAGMQVFYRDTGILPCGYLDYGSNEPQGIGFSSGISRKRKSLRVWYQPGGAYPPHRDVTQFWPFVRPLREWLELRQWWWEGPHADQGASLLPATQTHTLLGTWNWTGVAIAGPLSSSSQCDHSK